MSDDSRDRAEGPVPPGSGRMETGPVQFGDDWPGLFMRGDHAVPMGIALDDALAAVGHGLTPVVAAVLRGLAQTLQSCRAPCEATALGGPDELRRLREERAALIKAARVWWLGLRPIGWTEKEHREHPFVNLPNDSCKPLAAMLAAEMVTGASR